jgi:hypothetical protein
VVRPAQEKQQGMTASAWISHCFWVAPSLPWSISSPCARLGYMFSCQEEAFVPEETYMLETKPGYYLLNMELVSFAECWQYQSKSQNPDKPGHTQ